jgi:hypothetical protein
MGSVRERLDREREAREAPEKIAPTDNRRVALTGGPTLSTRQQADLVASQNEVTVRPTERTSAASVQYEVGGFSRVRDRQSIAADAAAAKPQPRPDSAASSWEAMYKRWDDEAKASEQAKVAALQKRLANEKAAADTKRQAAEKQREKAQYEFKENAVLRECSDLSPAEQHAFWEKLVAMNACLDAGAASIVAEEIRSSRKV